MTTSVTVLLLFVRALSDLGVDWRSVLARCGIDPCDLEDPEARIPQESFERLWIAARDITGDPGIGLHAGERVKPRAVNLFGYMMLSSATLGQGIHRVARYQQVLTGDPWIAVEESGEEVAIRVGIERGDAEFRAIHSEYVAPLLLKLLSWVSESEVAPVETRFAHAPRTDPDDYRRILRGPLRFSADRSQLVLAAGTLERRSVHANAQIAEVHEEFAKRLLESESEAISAQVRRTLAGRLESGAPDQVTVARELGMSPRSLQRRLAEEGTSFRGVLEDLRRDLIRKYLVEDATPITEVAYLTGFSDVSTFARAVRRWYGRPPARLRMDRAG